MLCFTCLSVPICVAEKPAVCGNEHQVAIKLGTTWSRCLDLLKTSIMRNHMGGWGETWVENSPSILSRIISGMVWITPTITQAAGVSPSILTVLFRCIRRGLVDRSHSQFPEIFHWATACKCRVSPNDKSDFLTGNVRIKSESKVS